MILDKFTLKQQMCQKKWDSYQACYFRDLEDSTLVFLLKRPPASSGAEKDAWVGRSKSQRET